MFRIWAKVLVKDKIVKQIVLEKFESLDYSKFFDYVREICEMLEIGKNE